MSHSKKLLGDLTSATNSQPGSTAQLPHAHHLYLLRS
jgi:hypothetical protein